VLNSTSDAIVSIDDSDRIGDTNPAFAVMFGHPEDAPERIAISEVIAPEYRQEFCNALKSFRARGEPAQIQVRARRHDGTHFDADCAFGRGQHSRYIVCSIRDISRIAEAGRMRDRFISMVNHELRTPITVITLSSNLLHTYYDRMTDEKRLVKIRQISHQARVMSELIESILDLSRLDTSEERVFTRMDVCPVAHEMITELQESAENKHQQLFITCTADNRCEIEANEQDIRRIWRNLIGNAIKYTPENGQIHVRIGGMTIDDGKIQEGPVPSFEVPPDLQPGSYLVGQVEDNGPGIPSDDIKQLFSRFYRGWAASSHIPGTGLGLALVKEVLALYGGDIVVTSQLGAGSCFTFFIPRAQQAVEDRATVGS
jgi:PAS domain S-box-containing protein